MSAYRPRGTARARPRGESRAARGAPSRVPAELEAARSWLGLVAPCAAYAALSPSGRHRATLGQPTVDSTPPGGAHGVVASRAAQGCSRAVPLATAAHGTERGGPWHALAARRRGGSRSREGRVYRTTFQDSGALHAPGRAHCPTAARPTRGPHLAYWLDGRVPQVDLEQRAPQHEGVLARGGRLAVAYRLAARHLRLGGHRDSQARALATTRSPAFPSLPPPPSRPCGRRAAASPPPSPCARHRRLAAVDEGPRSRSRPRPSARGQAGSRAKWSSVDAYQMLRSTHMHASAAITARLHHLCLRLGALGQLAGRWRAVDRVVSSALPMNMKSVGRAAGSAPPRGPGCSSAAARS